MTDVAVEQKDPSEPGEAPEAEQKPLGLNAAKARLASARRARQTYEPDWFLNLGLVSDSLYEARRVPTGAGAQSSQSPGTSNVFGRDSQYALVQTVVVSASLPGAKRWRFWCR